MTMSSKSSRGYRIPVSKPKSKQKKMSALFSLTILARDTVHNLCPAPVPVPGRESHWVVTRSCPEVGLKDAYKSNQASQPGCISYKDKSREGFLSMLPVKKI